MLENKINLTPQEILDKEFKIDTRGYRLKEVDQFLDLIIGDYEQFIQMLKDSEKEKEELLEQIMSLKQEIRNLKMSIEIAKTGDVSDNTSNGGTNIDLMRRLAQLEKIVYGKNE